MIVDKLHLDSEKSAIVRKLVKKNLKQLSKGEKSIVPKNLKQLSKGEKSIVPKRHKDVVPKPQRTSNPVDTNDTDTTDVTTKLYRAVYEGDINRVKKYTKRGADVSDDAVYIAVQDGHLNIVKYLMKHVDVSTEQLNFLLETACGELDQQMITFLITKGANDFLRAINSAEFGYITKLEEGRIEESSLEKRLTKIIINLLGKASDDGGREVDVTSSINFASKRGLLKLTKILITYMTKDEYGLEEKKALGNDYSFKYMLRGCKDIIREDLFKFCRRKKLIPKDLMMYQI